MKVIGKYTIIGTDIRTGESEVIEQNNLILDGVLNHVASITRPENIRYFASRMTLGTSDEPAQPSDTGIKGVLIAQVIKTQLWKKRSMIPAVARAIQA